MKNNKIKAVAVGGLIDEKGRERMIMLLGAFENATEAYGKAYLYLDELAGDSREHELIITPLYKLEGDTGYAMYAQDKNGDAKYYAYVLFNDNCENRED